MAKYFIIRHMDSPDLFWRVGSCWGGKDQATRLEQYEIDLPKPGLWYDLRADLSWAEQLALQVVPRRPLDDDGRNGYMESDRDWMENNRDVLIRFMELSQV